MILHPHANKRKTPTGVMRKGIAPIAVVLLLVLMGSNTGLTQGSEAAQPPDPAFEAEVPREHFFVTRGPDGPRVLQIIHVTNADSRPVDALLLPVPAVADWLELPSHFVTGEGQVWDPHPLQPGETRQYALAYEPDTGGAFPLTLRRALLYPTEEILLWVEHGSLGLRGLHLQALGQDDVSGTTFDVYRMSGLRPHDTWQVVIEPVTSDAAALPRLMGPGMRSDPLEILAATPIRNTGMILGGILLLAGTIWVLRRMVVAPRAMPAVTASQPVASDMRGTGSPAGNGSPAATDNPSDTGDPSPADGSKDAAKSKGKRQEEIQQLKEAIVHVDVAYQTGELDEDIYRQRRDHLKARLVQLVRHRDGGTAS